MAEGRIPAKLARPRLFDAIDRTRLFAALDAQRGRALVWVAGPPGSGKTTLVTSYLARERVATLWYRMDEGDADAATFFSYLAQGARALTRKRKLNLPALTPEYLLDLPGFTRRYFRTLFDALPKQAALVLDAYEAVAGSALDALVALAVEEVPPGVRVLVTSREAPPAGLAHLEAKGALALIPWEELRLTETEAREIAAAARVLSIPVETLHRLSDGWAAGFVVLLEHMRRAGVPEVQASGRLRESLFAYFVNEMFARAEEAVRTVLLRTALMPGFTGEQAQALCPQTEAQVILERLYRRHYFIDRSAGPEPVYRYHALFQEFLLAQGRVLLAPEERLRLLEQGAELLETANRKEDALALYTEAQAWARAGELIRELAPVLLGGGRNAVLDRAISALPQAVIDDVPWLAYWLGMARVVFNPPAGRALLEAAYAKFEAAGDHTGCVLACAGVLDTYMAEWTDMRPIDRWGAVFETLQQRGHVSVSQDVEIRALAALAVLHFRGDVHETLLAQAYARAVGLIPLVGDAMQRISLASFCGPYCVLCGKWAELRSLTANVDAMLSELEAYPMQRLMWESIKMWQALQSGAFDDAAKLVVRVEALAESAGIRVLDSFIAGHGAHAALNAGNLVMAQVYVDRMRAGLIPAHILDVANYDYFSAELALARGNLALAMGLARASLEKIVACGSTVAKAQVQVVLSHALLEQEEYAAALDETDTVIGYAVAARHGALEHAGLMLKSQALHGLGRIEEAGQALRTALEMGRKAEVVAIFPWAPVRFVQRVYGLALEHGIETDYVRSLIRKLKLPPPENAGERWPWPVRIHTLGRFEIHIDDARVEYSRKLPKRPLALLKFLLARRGEARVEQAIDALWPEEEADAAANALDAALHRLRRLLGGAGTVELHDGQLSLNRASMWVDALAFEQALDRAERAGAVLYEQALASYRGHFLAADQAESWSISARERLRSRYIRAVTAHGRALHGAGELEAAAAHYARAIDVDDLVEAFYQGLMQCQLALKQKSEGLAAYERLKRTLAAGLNLQPAAESERLHQALRDL